MPIPAPTAMRCAEETPLPGGYRIGSTPAMRDHLAASVGNRVHFAGEATHRAAYRTVHGAYLSGLRAAKDVLG